jgi:hypothetical protein
VYEKTIQNIKGGTKDFNIYFRNRKQK